MGKASGTDPLLGQVVGGRYEIVRQIGRGGMGAIYEVRNTRVGRAFAMKTLIGEAADDLEVLARFRREADVVARIKHPNIVEVIDWESLEDGSPCIILEYLDGVDLARRIRASAPLAWSAIALIGDQILSALAVAHAAGVIHRDLKPQNIFLARDDTGEERAKLLDFGVSKIRDSRSLVTTDARLLGTPAYMSPEQAEGRHDDIGPATDLWAMGAILYEMATGVLAFDGASMPAVLYRICSRDADPVEQRRPDAPPAFAALVREALSRDPAGRLDDAGAFRKRLREALGAIADVRYSDALISGASGTAAGSGANGSTPRRKRQTGAHEKTLASTEDDRATPATAPTVASGEFDRPTPLGAGEVSTSSTVPRRRIGPMLAGLAAAAALAALAMTVVALATRPEATALAPSDVPVIPAPTIAPPPRPIDAAVPVVPAVVIDAALAPPAPTPRPHARPRHVPTPVAPAPTAEARPPAPPPPQAKAGCDRFDKNDPKYQLCIYGDGGGM